MMLSILTQLAIIQLISYAIINDRIGHLCEIFVLCHCSWVSVFIVLGKFFCNLWCGLHVFMDINYPVLVYGRCCLCAINLIDLLGKLCDSCWVSVFQLVFIFIFKCVALSAVLNGVLLCDHWVPRCH